MKLKKTIIWLVVVTTGVALIFFLLNLFVKKKVEAELSNLVPPVAYEELRVNVLLNSFRLTKVKTRQETFSLNAKKIELNGLSYYQFLFNDRVEVREVKLEMPKIKYFSQQESQAGDGPQKTQLKVGTFLLENGNFSSMKSDTSGVDLHVRFPQIEIKGVDNSGTLKIQSYSAKLDSVYYRLNTEHFIQIGNAEGEGGRVKLSDFRIVPFDSKEDFIKNIPYEKDRISLEVNEINMENFTIDRVRDTIFLKESKMIVSDAFLEIYRNKLIKDDVRKKSLYSELLREASIKLNFERVLVENSEIIYEEQVQEGRQAAIIRFTDVSAKIRNLHNLPSKDLPQPVITARANFMRGTPVELTWTFPVFDRNNRFNISGSFGALQGEALDPFLVPALDLQARGEITAINFDFQGNEEKMAGEFKMDYVQLEVDLMEEEGEKKRSFLSTIANLFVKNKGEEGVQEEKLTVERDPLRSFWNYVWLGLRKGFLETVSQL